MTPKKRTEPYKVPFGRGARGRGRFSQNTGRGRTPAAPVVLRRWEYYKIIRSDEGLTLKTSASKSLYGGQFTLSSQLIKPNYPFKVGGLKYSVHEWKVTTSDPQ